MPRGGQIVLFRFPHTDQTSGKLRPLIIRRAPGRHSDWLTCLISRNLDQQVARFDEMITEIDEDFASSGLTQTCIIRLGRLAVIEEGVLLGAIGHISSERLRRIHDRLAAWLKDGFQASTHS